MVCGQAQRGKSLRGWLFEDENCDETVIEIGSESIARTLEAMSSRQGSIAWAKVRSREVTMGNNAGPALLLER